MKNNIQILCKNCIRSRNGMTCLDPEPQCSRDLMRSEKDEDHEDCKPERC